MKKARTTHSEELLRSDEEARKEYKRAYYRIAVMLRFMEPGQVAEFNEQYNKALYKHRGTTPAYLARLEAVYIAWMNGLDEKQIAKQFDVSIKSVHRQLNAALRKYTVRSV